MEGAYLSNHYSFDDPAPEVQKFVAAYRSAYKTEPDSIAALSYDALRLAADALSERGFAAIANVDGPLSAQRLQG